MAESFFDLSPLTVLSNKPTMAPRCGECKLYKTCRTKKMEPSGSGRRKILIVGEAPGAQEDREGVQFVGDSGQLLEETLAEFGVDMREDCWLTNSLICRPPNNKIPKPEVIDYCRPNVIRTITELKPRVVVLLGAVAVKSVIEWLWHEDPGGVGRWAGFRIPSHRINAWVCPTFHPAALLWQPNDLVSRRLFRQHLKAACRLRSRPWEVVPDYGSEVEILTDDREASERVSELVESSWLCAIDFETDRLKPDTADARIASCAISTGVGTVAFPWGRRVARTVKRIMMDESIGKIAQNLQMEDRWTRRVLGAEVRGWVWDTMTTAHALDNGGKGRAVTGLKFQSFVNLGVANYEDAIRPYLTPDWPGGNEPNRVFRAPPDKLLLYNGLDALLTYRLALKQASRVGVVLVPPGGGRR